MAARSTSFRAGRWWPVGFEPVTEDDLAPLPKGFAAVDEADLAPEVRQPSNRYNMPAAKTDEELGLDEGPKFSREFPQFQRGGKTVFGLSGTIVPDAKSAPGTNAYRGAHSGDEMNDPIAQALTGAAIAAPVAALAPAALAPAVSGGVQAATQGQDPITGAALGAVSGFPAAARAARTAVGEAAVKSAFSPPKPPGPIMKAIEHAAGAGAGGALGHATGLPFAGYAGAAGGAALAGAARAGVTAIGRKLTTALASRHLARLAATAEPGIVGEVAGRYAAPPAAKPGGGFPDTLELNPQEPAPPIYSTPKGPEPPGPGPAPAPDPVYDDTFWKEAQRDWGVTHTDVEPAAKTGNHATVGGATAVTPEVAGDISRLRAEGAELLGKLGEIRARGIEHAPPELAARAQEVMNKIAALEKTAASPYVVKARAVAELTKDARGGATKEQLAYRAKRLGLSEEEATKIGKAKASAR